MRRRAPLRRMRSVSKRSAVVLAAALACLFITVLMSTVLARSVSDHHRLLKRHEREVQAASLAQSAAQLAEMRLRADPEYGGETWIIAPEDMPGNGSGRAIIGVSDYEEDENHRKVHIEAMFPDDPVNRTLVKTTILVRVNDDED